MECWNSGLMEYWDYWSCIIPSW